VARRLGYRFVDTGMMYRAFAWLALQRGLDLHDERALTQLALVVSMRVELGPADAPETARVFIDGVDATDHLRTTEVGEAVSLASRVPAVREAMVALQRDLAREGGVVMAGRDIGTVVLPDAELKVYLDASSEERVRRRHEELRALGRNETADDVRAELGLRDEIDSGRATSPLRPADGALVIDTGGLSLDAVVDRIMKAFGCS
jgi:cytidylate kinase